MASQKSNPQRTCENISSDGLKCFRKIPRHLASERVVLCEYHTVALKEKSQNTFNDTCPICQENDESLKPGTIVSEEHGDKEVKWYPLPCMHRAHIHCMEGMNKLECPMCRSKIINLPDSVKLKIEENAKKLAAENLEEQLRADREFMENLALEHHIRPPPQMELFMALRYLFELGICPSLIPGGLTLEIDPESPLPPAGFIFQNAVANIIEHIQSRIRDRVSEEDDSKDGFEDDLDALSTDEEDPFQMEGDDLRVVHSIQTVPLLPQNRQPGERIRARVDRSVFNTMRFVISDLPPLTEEDFDLINILNGASQDDFID